jgi:hypothetical protein
MPRPLRPTDPRPAVAHCTCRHAVTSHRIDSRGYRARCQAGSCGCRLFVSAKAAGG